MSRPVVIALIGLIVAAAAAFLALDRAGTGEGPQALPAVQSLPVPPEAAARAGEPSFDVVRVDRNGDTVIAGRAMPRAEVVILDGDTEIGRTIADNRGEWVFVPTGPLKPGSRELRLEAQNPDGTATRSGAPVVLVVPERNQGPALVLKTLPGGGSRLLQGPAADGTFPVTIDVVDHDDQGRLFVGGKASPGSKIHLYLDNRFIGRADADGDGAWRVSGKSPAAPGAHTLRADLVGRDGKVQARVEVPYTPAADRKLAQAGLTRVVVEQGTSLWRIARKAYGSGVAYTVIFQANRDRIRDPDMIYPGQVFTVPAR